MTAIHTPTQRFAARANQAADTGSKRLGPGNDRLPGLSGSGVFCEAKMTPIVGKRQRTVDGVSRYTVSCQGRSIQITAPAGTLVEDAGWRVEGHHNDGYPAFTRDECYEQAAVILASDLELGACTVCAHGPSVNDKPVETADGWAHAKCKKKALGGERWLKGLSAPIVQRPDDHGTLCAV